MATTSPSANKPGFRGWLNKRLPVDDFVTSQLTDYFAPKNFNVWYYFGALALLVFVMQIVTSIQHGGAERIACDLAENLPRHGVRSRLVCLGKPHRTPLPAPPDLLDFSHLSFVHGQKQVDFLRARYQGMSAHHFFRGMEFTTDRAEIPNCESAIATA